MLEQIGSALKKNLSPSEIKYSMSKQIESNVEGNKFSGEGKRSNVEGNRFGREEKGTAARGASIGAPGYFSFTKVQFKKEAFSGGKGGCFLEKCPPGEFRFG